MKARQSGSYMVAKKSARAADYKSADHRLTLRAIEALEPRPGAQYVAWDTDIRGFGVRVSPAGSRTYILKYRLTSGRVRWASIDRVGVVTLAQARQRARQLLGVVATGDDPLHRKDVARGAPTVSTVADRFLEEHVEARRKPSTIRLYRLAVASHIRPFLGQLAIADVSRADVVRLHHHLRATPYLANRVLAVLSKLCSWSEDYGYRPPASNPCRGVEKYTEQPRQRYLSVAELSRLGAALRNAERYKRISPSAVAVIRLLLFTGARVSEILSLRWSDVDLAAGMLRLPDSKSGRKTILLSAPAIEILDAWPHFAGSPFVFPGEGPAWRKGEHRVSLTDAWEWIRRRARLVDVRIHDLRHSFASVAVSNGQSLPTIGALLGHTQAATTQRYAHLMDDPLRAASNATAATIAAALKRRPR